MSPSTTPSGSGLPPPSPNQVYVQISALSSGWLTLPERLFVTNADPEKLVFTPSLSFLISHPSPNSSKQTTNLVFDLSLKQNLSNYPPAMHAHIANRQPITTTPDVATSLRAGGIDPTTDIDTVILSHVHWDHIGDPDHFPASTFVVGSGTLHLLEHGAPTYPAEIFDTHLLPSSRTYELPPTPDSAAKKTASSLQTSHAWAPLAHFPIAVDFYGDGSLYVIDSPGPLYGHVNLLARIGEGRWVYLGGDCCHDTRLLKGKREVAMYDDGKGGLRSVHMDTPLAAKTVEKVRRLVEMGGKEVEVVLAHDHKWFERNAARFLPGHL
ncbi:hypothetical protein MMC08_004630 [Hypocenomyce scalaris]|nr:hypothetical protein [Hypocenomyce scalaris]